MNVNCGAGSGLTSRMIHLSEAFYNLSNVWKYISNIFVLHLLSSILFISIVFVLAATNRPEPMLMGVFPDERYMLDVISEAVRQVSINKPGPRAFLASYDDYFYILNGEAKQDLLAFFAQEPPPYLKVGVL